jgi:hypothetical protein
MHDAMLVGILQRVTDLFRDRQGLFERNGANENAICESRPLYELHHKRGLVRIFESVDGRDIGMIQ